jgi:signal transduction histidine kinase
MGFLHALDRSLSRWPRTAILVLCLLLAILVGAADLFRDEDFLLLYLIPLYIAASYGGIRVGLVVAIYAAAAEFLTAFFAPRFWEVSQLSAAYSANPVTFVIRLIAFLIIAYLIGRLRETRRQQAELTSFIVHDLRSPLASAITGLMTLEQTEALSTTGKEMVELSLVSNNRALDLVNSILDVRKLESGKMEVRPERVDVVQMVEESIQAVALWAQSSEVKIAPTVHRAEAVLDRALTSRVLINLLSNALKFSPPGSAIALDVHAERDGVRFSIHDEGPGIPAEALETLFDPFSQVKGTQGGTGLGLTFCRLAVRAQGGKIGVQSRPGHGTTFWFVLPPLRLIEKIDPPSEDSDSPDWS